MLQLYGTLTTTKNKVEAVQKRAARWTTKDYSYTPSVTAMLNDLYWCPLDQRRIDSKLLIMYKGTYDLVATPAPEYLVRNTRQSRRIRSLANRQIHTLKTITGSHFSPGLPSNGTLSLPIYQFFLPLLEFSNAVCQVIHMSP